MPFMSQFPGATQNLSESPQHVKSFAEQTRKLMDPVFFHLEQLQDGSLTNAIRRGDCHEIRRILESKRLGGGFFRTQEDSCQSLAPNSVSSQGAMAVPESVEIWRSGLNTADDGKDRLQTFLDKVNKKMRLHRPQTSEDSWKRRVEYLEALVIEIIENIQMERLDMERAKDKGVVDDRGSDDALSDAALQVVLEAAVRSVYRSIRWVIAGAGRKRFNFSVDKATSGKDFDSICLRHDKEVDPDKFNFALRSIFPSDELRSYRNGSVSNPRINAATTLGAIKQLRGTISTYTSTREHIASELLRALRVSSPSQQIFNSIKALMRTGDTLTRPGVTTQHSLSDSDRTMAEIALAYSAILRVDLEESLPGLQIMKNDQLVEFLFDSRDTRYSHSRIISPAASPLKISATIVRDASVAQKIRRLYSLVLRPVSLFSENEALEPLCPGDSYKTIQSPSMNRLQGRNPRPRLVPNLRQGSLASRPPKHIARTQDFLHGPQFLVPPQVHLAPQLQYPGLPVIPSQFLPSEPVNNGQIHRPQAAPSGQAPPLWAFPDAHVQLERIVFTQDNNGWIHTTPNGYYRECQSNYIGCPSCAGGYAYFVPNCCFSWPPPEPDASNGMVLVSPEAINRGFPQYWNPSNLVQTESHNNIQ